MQKLIEIFEHTDFELAIDFQWICRVNNSKHVVPTHGRNLVW